MSLSIDSNYLSSKAPNVAENEGLKEKVKENFLTTAASFLKTHKLALGLVAALAAGLSWYGLHAFNPVAPSAAAAVRSLSIQQKPLETAAKILSLSASEKNGAVHNLADKKAAEAFHSAEKPKPIITFFYLHSPVPDKSKFLLRARVLNNKIKQCKSEDLHITKDFTHIHHIFFT